jgi:hypothetical protein
MFPIKSPILPLESGTNILSVLPRTWKILQKQMCKGLKNHPIDWTFAISTPFCNDPIQQPDKCPIVIIIVTGLAGNPSPVSTSRNTRSQIIYSGVGRLDMIR